MSTAAQAPSGFAGHPGGLRTLFFTEMWERFSYYGMRALLILYMTAGAATGGLGLDVAVASAIYGLYTGMVYFTAIPGGWIADRLLGPKRAVLLGGTLIALGHYSIAANVRTLFYAGLALIALGTGLLKPNISSMVGQLYGPDDKRRDSGFSIFYMGINLGGWLAPIVCGFLAQDPRFRVGLASIGIHAEHTWHWGFAAAAIGMTLALVQYLLDWRRLEGIGERTQTVARPGLAWAAVVMALVGLGALLWATQEWKYAPTILAATVATAFFVWLLTQARDRREIARTWALMVLFAFSALFWAAFEQAGSSLNLFAEHRTRLSLLGFTFPASTLQSVNSMFIWMLAPVLAWLWLRLGTREPSSPAKFALGLLFVGLGFVPVAIAAHLSDSAGGALVSPLWLIALYLLHTLGELCLSPVGLSTVTKLAPERLVGSMMGIWFLSLSLGNFIGGAVAGNFEKLPLPQLFGAVAGTTLLATLLLAVLVPSIKRLMGGVK
jgi:proton-dependent oligopeptide transporter, POT family